MAGVWCCCNLQLDRFSHGKGSDYDGKALSGVLHYCTAKHGPKGPRAGFEAICFVKGIS